MNNKWRNNYQYFLFRCLHSSSCITNLPTWSPNEARWSKKFHNDALNLLKQKIISPEKRGTLTEPLKLMEPHYKFCGTPVEEH